MMNSYVAADDTQSDSGSPGTGTFKSFVDFQNYNGHLFRQLFFSCATEINDPFVVLQRKTVDGINRTYRTWVDLSVENLCEWVHACAGKRVSVWASRRNCVKVATWNRSFITKFILWEINRKNHKNHMHISVEIWEMCVCVCERFFLNIF